MTGQVSRHPGAHEAAVATKAVLRAAERLQVANRVLARVIGISEASVSRMRAGTYLLTPPDKSFELALLFIRLYRALDAVVDGDEVAAAAWLRSDNQALGSTPLAMVQSVSGLMHVLQYLDTRRALA